MKLSVIIPIYNVEKYLKKALLSVLQNDMQNKDFEVILIDDESPDNSIESIKPFITSNCKIIFQKNKGLGGARNTGIKNALGKYLLFLDADDIILPNTLTTIVDLAIKNSLDILEFAAKGIDENENEIYHIENSTNGEIYEGVTYYNKFRYMNSACNKLYLRDFIVNNHLFFLEKIFIEDFEFNTRVLAKAKRVMATNFVVSNFLQTQNSITRNSSKEKKEKMIADIIFVIDKTVEEQSKNQTNKENDDFFEERKSFLIATLFYQLVKNKSSAKEFIALKKELQSKDLFFVNHPIHDSNKNLFRRIILKNTWLYYCLSPFLNLKL